MPNPHNTAFTTEGVTSHDMGKVYQIGCSKVRRNCYRVILENERTMKRIAPMNHVFNTDWSPKMVVAIRTFMYTNRRTEEGIEHMMRRMLKSDLERLICVDRTRREIITVCEAECIYGKTDRT